MSFLQAAQIVQKSTEVILNYGAIGAILLICMVVIYIMGRYFGRQLTAVNDRMNKYVDEDRKQMMDVISKNTVAFTQMTAVVEELRSEIHEFKTK